MGLRPARTCRGVDKVPWARYSKRRPRKSFVKALPHSSLNVFSMGTKGDYELRMDLVAKYAIQIRDNAIESARQSTNKHLEKLIAGNYSLGILVYPHNVIRENKMISGAGADRLQKGMRKAYGKPTDRAARIWKNQTLFSVFVDKKNIRIVSEAYRRGRGKLPGSFSVITTVLKSESAN
ncbi:MAG: 50S ribosomal protein L16 [Candidatus Micrarchaeota archaeon]